MTDYQSPVPHDHVHRHAATSGKHYHDQSGTPKDHSPRIEGEEHLSEVWNGVTILKIGDKGKPVLRLQQALIDMGHLDASFSDRGTFETQTEEAVILFQMGNLLAGTGIVTKSTLKAIDAQFDARTDYVQAATDFDPKAPKKGTRALSPDEQTDAKDQLSPAPSVAGASFKAADAPKYAAEIKTALGMLIPKFYNELYLTKKKDRADPAKNFHQDGDLEGAANAGKDITDQLYGAMAKGPKFSMGVNLIDQWEDEENRNKTLNKAEKRDKADNKIRYLINANLSAINRKYNASPSGAEEKKVLDPMVATLVANSTIVDQLLAIETGWKGAQLDGVQYLQRFKNPGIEKNRLHMWKLFHTSIHEYLHSLAHNKYKKWAEKLGGAEYHTLTEGFCDFFTLNVRAAFPPSKLKSVQAQVEGDFYKKDEKGNSIKARPIPNTSSLGVGVYPAHQEAERMVGVIGVRNAQLGYFKGQTDLMGE